MNNIAELKAKAIKPWFDEQRDESMPIGLVDYWCDVLTDEQRALWGSVGALENEIHRGTYDSLR
jgi:hypothetical protein